MGVKCRVLTEVKQSNCQLGRRYAFPDARRTRVRGVESGVAANRGIGSLNQRVEGAPDKNTDLDIHSSSSETRQAASKGRNGRKAKNTREEKEGEDGGGWGGGTDKRAASQLSQPSSRLFRAPQTCKFILEVC